MDGNRVRFTFNDWKSLVATKVLRERVGDILGAAWKTPGRVLTPTQKMWLQVFWEVMEGVKQSKDGKA